MANLRIKPSYVLAAYRCGPVLALYEEYLGKKRQTLSRLIVPECDVDFLRVEGIKGIPFGYHDAGNSLEHIANQVFQDPASFGVRRRLTSAREQLTYLRG